jgi:hypothetical protein
MELAMTSADAERIAHVTFFIVLLPIDLTKMVNFNPTLAARNHPSRLRLRLECDIPMVHHLHNSFDVVNMLEEIQVLDYLRVAYHNPLGSP